MKDIAIVVVAEIKRRSGKMDEIEFGKFVCAQFKCSDDAAAERILSMRKYMFNHFSHQVQLRRTESGARFWCHN